MNAITQIDGNILLWVQENLRNDALTPVWKIITSLADKGWFWILITFVLLFFKKTRPIGIMAAGALACSVIINNAILKNLVARPRPYLPETIGGRGLTLLIEPQPDFSFPSGHAGASFACSIVFLRKLPKKFGIPAFILAILIAFSRIYVGVHYPSDVLAGMITGTCCAFLSMFIYEKLIVVFDKKIPPLARFARGECLAIGAGRSEESGKESEEN